MIKKFNDFTINEDNWFDRLASKFSWSDDKKEKDNKDIENQERKNRMLQNDIDMEKNAKMQANKAAQEQERLLANATKLAKELQQKKDAEAKELKKQIDDDEILNAIMLKDRPEKRDLHISAYEKERNKDYGQDLFSKRTGTQSVIDTERLQKSHGPNNQVTSNPATTTPTTTTPTTTYPTTGYQSSTPTYTSSFGVWDKVTGKYTKTGTEPLSSARRVRKKKIEFKKEVNCEECDTQLLKDAVYCHNCGHKK